MQTGQLYEIVANEPGQAVAIIHATAHAGLSGPDRQAFISGFAIIRVVATPAIMRRRINYDFTSHVDHADIRSIPADIGSVATGICNGVSSYIPAAGTAVILMTDGSASDGQQGQDCQGQRE
jgi:hypothetical protein